VIAAAAATTALAITRASPSIGFFMLDMAINYTVILIVAFGYIALMYLVAFLTRGRERSAAFLGGTRAGVLFLALALPTYIFIGTAFRHVPPFSGSERGMDSYFVYVAATRVALVAVYALGVLLAIVRSRVLGAQWPVALAPALPAVGFIVLTLPLAEFANACYIGVSFLLPGNC
jgi:hypothetical protein